MTTASLLHSIFSWLILAPFMVARHSRTTDPVDPTAPAIPPVVSPTDPGYGESEMPPAIPPTVAPEQRPDFPPATEPPAIAPPEEE